VSDYDFDTFSPMLVICAIVALLFGGCGFALGRATQSVSIDVTIQRDGGTP
jgi:hypothetical protein